MAVRIRKSLHSLGPGDQTLSWYRRAVDALIKRPATDPTSWRYMAAVHGVPQGIATPPAAQGFWDQCQHQSWFFLPWHRGYITAFEAVIAETVAGLGGPADWALPYWNYSEDLQVQPKARLMPDDLFLKTIAGKSNALWSRRANVQHGDFNLGPDVVTLDALKFRNFANAHAGSPSGFGGPVTGFNPGGGDNGGVESLPHNRIHTRIGGDTGFMSDPATAALDPIFWLHHCNIDRLWEVWRNQGAQFATPTDPRWLTGVTFKVHDGKGKVFTYRSVDMLDTTKVLHGYQYDHVPVAKPAAAHAPHLGIAPTTQPEAASVAQEHPELAGANDAPLDITAGNRTIVSLAPTRRTSFAAAALPNPEHVYLNLENVTGTGIAADYAVFIDMPDDAEQPVRVGTLTTFGIARASLADGDQGGSGINQVFDITGIAERLGLTDGTINRLHVSFEPLDLAKASDEAPEGLAEFAAAADNRPAPSVKVGRVSLFYA